MRTEQQVEKGALRECKQHSKQRKKYHKSQCPAPSMGSDFHVQLPGFGMDAVAGLGSARMICTHSSSAKGGC